ncbi:MAG TPA: hypothetical protein VIQ03_13955 [Gammaproteobacteria bacterium]
MAKQPEYPEKCRKSSKKSDFTRVIELANLAKRQGELALIQSQKPTTGPQI